MATTTKPADAAAHRPEAGANAAARAASEGDGWGAASALLRDGTAVHRLKRTAETYRAVDADLAEDLVADAMVVLKRGVDAGKVRDPLAYAGGTVINLARAEQRRVSTLAPYDPDDRRTAQEFDDPFAELPDPDEPLSESDISVITRLEGLAARIEQARPREVVEYVLEAVKGGRLDGISDSEVGGALGISEGAAKIARLRGIERLRRLVLDEDEDLARDLESGRVAEATAHDPQEEDE